MTNLAEDTPQQWESYAGEHNARLTIAAGQGTIYVGQILAYHATNPEEVITPTDLLADRFAGIAMDGGIAGDVISVRQVGLLGPLVVAGTFAAGTEGDEAFGEMSATADNNPALITETTLNNLPLGKIARVVLAGAGATVVIKVGADGFRGDG